MANQQNQVLGNGLIDTTVDVDPVAVVYNLQNDEIERFVEDYLSQARGIEGVAAVRVHAVRDGNRNPELAIYVFIDQKSKDVFTSMKKVPAHLQHKMDTGGFRAGDKLQNALRPIAGELKLSHDNRQKLVYIKLNVFKVIGLMLGAEPRRHNLTISEVVRMKKRSIATVIKSNRFPTNDDRGGFDKFNSIIERNEH